MTLCTLKWKTAHIHKAISNINENPCKDVNFLNILQAPDYALAIGKFQNLTPRMADIEIDGKTAGYVLILETKALGGLLHALIMDRGPVWKNGFGCEAHFKAFITAFKNHYPKRPFRRVRLIPEIEDSTEIREFLEKQGYKRRPHSSYQTIALDLTQDIASLLQNMKKNWRNALTKAEKTDLTIEHCSKTGAEPLKWLLKHYALDKAQRGYDGPSVKLLTHMAQTFGQNGNMLICRALKNDRPIAGILLFMHGPSATYQIGWTSDKGRGLNAHHLLLWNAIQHLKTLGFKTLDLGGMNDQTAKGVKTFKEGLGGKCLILPGLYT